VRRTGSSTLHVVSEVNPTGGHSRVVAKWVQRDLGSSHAVVLTRQRAAVPAFLQRIWDDRGAPVTLLRAEEPVDVRARQVKSLASGFDRVILHTHPDDAVPVVAFARPGGCPVAMFNHAHFWFSLGSTVSDIIINTLPYFQQVTRRHRFPRETALLRGGGLEPLRWVVVDKRAAKANLGLPEEGPVAMTIGHENYFSPGNGYDFYDTAGKLMERQPDLTLLVVGVHETCPWVPERLKSSGRVRLLGPVVDPTPFYCAADVCLESFPMPSLGGLVESVAYGEAFPVPVYGPGENIVRVSLVGRFDYEFRPRTEEEYLAYVCRLLAARDETRGKAAGLRRVLVESDERYGEQFAPLYRQIDALRHMPGEIPATTCCAEEDNRILASFTEPDVCRKINQLLPLGPAVLAHLKAALHGHERMGLAAERIMRRSLGGLRRMGRRVRNRSPRFRGQFTV